MIKRSILLALLSLGLLQSPALLAKESDGQTTPAFAVDKETLAATCDIVIGTDNIDLVKEKLKELIIKFNAETHYDVDTLAPKNRRALIEIGLDNGSAPALLEEIINLGGIKSNHYHRYDQQNSIADLSRRLVNLKAYLAEYSKKQPTATNIKTITDKINTINNRLTAAQNNTWQPTWSKITVTFQQQDKDYNLITTIQNIKINWPLVISAVVFLVIGLFIRNFISNIPKA